MAISRPESAPAHRLLPEWAASRLHLARYTAFAASAIAINILSQNAALAFLGHLPFAILIAMAYGTGAGLVFKYICDKHWVFADEEKLSAKADGRKFALYAFFGLFTTFLFWAVELAFHFAFKTQLMTNIGAVIGLCLGYAIKYNLDKGVTFRAAQKP